MKRKYKYWSNVNTNGMKRWYWHRVSKGKIVADSGQGYVAKASVLRAIHSDAGLRAEDITVKDAIAHGLYDIEDITNDAPSHMTIWFKQNITTPKKATKKGNKW